MSSLCDSNSAWFETVSTGVPSFGSNSSHLGQSHSAIRACALDSGRGIEIGIGAGIDGCLGVGVRVGVRVRVRGGGGWRGDACKAVRGNPSMRMPEPGADPAANMLLSRASPTTVSAPHPEDLSKLPCDYYSRRKVASSTWIDQHA